MTNNILDLTADRSSVPPPSISEPSPEVPPGDAPDASGMTEAEDSEFDVLLADTEGPDEVSWDAHAPYSAAAHTRRRLLSFGIIGAGLLTAVLQASWSTGLVVLAGIGAWMLRERLAMPAKVHIGQRGLTIDGHHTPHAQLASYDIHELRDGSLHLSLRTNARLSRQIHLPLGDQNPHEVRALLSRFVPEETHAIPFWEWWMRKK